jgi:type IV secretory pathway VirB3-like protein
MRIIAYKAISNKDTLYGFVPIDFVFLMAITVFTTVIVNYLLGLCLFVLLFFFLRSQKNRPPMNFAQSLSFIRMPRYFSIQTDKNVSYKAAKCKTQ